MTTQQLDAFFRSVLDIDGFGAVDPSLNGLQVDNDGAEVEKIAFAVDANLETFTRAAAAGAGMIFVHHGIFWGNPLRIQGSHRQRIQFLLDHNLALYGVHLPLDQQGELGNNAVLARLLGITNPLPFGLYRGRKIGYKGLLAVPLSIEEAVRRIAFMDRPPLAVYPFGKRESLSCAVVSGGAADDALQAIEEGVDLFVTGEASHEVYHAVLEGALNMIAGGHYSTEVWGVREMMERCAAQLNMEVEFIDVPTGL
ncbi:MAG: Nif3-like dinuclear metal center hexameric protein [Spirochaetaceae bacterium]|jgi:dinuclear metal center YbgI/SA1388 family protein|nr:Nif3-like dinuclear metal center hexameric protein [Spirochaetaceae bacterium]